VLMHDGEETVDISPTYAFFSSTGAPDIALRADFSPIEMPDAGKVFDSDGTWSLFRSESSRIYTFSAADESGSREPYCILELVDDLRLGVLYPLRPLRTNPAVYRPFDYPVSEVLTVHLLSRGRGVELHAAGIDDNGTGLLFCGVSGAGKSTTAHLWDRAGGARILSDDRIIVRRQDGAYRMYGTPWHGDGYYALPDSVPLRRLFFLHHGPENCLRELSATEAVVRLMTCCFATFWDREGMSFTMSFLSDLARTLPCYELTFMPDRSAVDFVRSL